VILSSVGESRIHGYLYVLERSLRTFLPRDTVADAVREIESHLRDRVASAEAAPDERAALERILAALGPPLQVAQAYSAERTIDEAVTTGRLVAVVRAIWQLAFTTMTGFFAALGLLVGYGIGAACFMVAALKPFLPNNVGFWVSDTHPLDFTYGGRFPVPSDAHQVGGYWIIPISIVCGLVIMVLTHRGARRVLAWFRQRRVHWRNAVAS